MSRQLFTKSQHRHNYEEWIVSSAAQREEWNVGLLWIRSFITSISPVCITALPGDVKTADHSGQSTPDSGCERKTKERKHRLKKVLGVAVHANKSLPPSFWDIKGTFKMKDTKCFTMKGGEIWTERMSGKVRHKGSPGIKSRDKHIKYNLNYIP